MYRVTSSSKEKGRREPTRHEYNKSLTISWYGPFLNCWFSGPEFPSRSPRCSQALVHLLGSCGIGNIDPIGHGTYNHWHTELANLAVQHPTQNWVKKYDVRCNCHSQVAPFGGLHLDWFRSGCTHPPSQVIGILLHHHHPKFEIQFGPHNWGCPASPQSVCNLTNNNPPSRTEMGVHTVQPHLNALIHHLLPTRPPEPPPAPTPTNLEIQGPP